jgi:tRNA dimethylallyltransferase
MLAQGLVEEVQTLCARGDLDLTLPSMRAVGYRQVYLYLAGELPESQLAEQGIIATRQLAKRQLTWLRAEKDAVWFDSLQAELSANVLKYLIRNPMLSATLASI